MVWDGFDVRGMKVLVTGASKGIGFAVAEGFAKAGAQIAMVSKTESALVESAEKLARRYEVKITAQVGDVSRPKDIKHCVDEILREFGKIDVLINNAGLNVRIPAVDVTEDNWDAVLDTDLKGAFFMAQTVGKHMIQQGSGRIINVSSVGGHVALRTGVAYAAAKAGLNHITRVLAVEWAQKGVRVNAIGPWYFKTPLTEKLLEDKAYVEDILARTPMRRVGDVQELVGPAIFLASHASSYVTGQILNVDGGMSVYGF